ncbi:EAL domain-containing protein [Marinobacter sp. PE14]
MKEDQIRMRILLVEDGENDFLITRDLLNQRGVMHLELECVNNTSGAEEALRASRHDLVLVDHRLGPETDTKLLQKPQSEAHYRIAFDSNPLAMLLVDSSNGQVLSLNRSARELYGIPDIDKCRITFDQLVFEEKQANSLANEEGFFARKGCSLGVHRRNDGTELFVEVQRQPLQVGHQELDLIIVVDVTGQLEQNRQLNFVHRAIEHTSDGIVISDARQPDMPVVYVNSAFERITGYSAQECFGRNCRFLQFGRCSVPDNSDNEDLARIREGLRSGQKISGVLRNFRKDGSPFWNELIVSPIRDNEGNVSHFIGILNDVSEQKAAEVKIAYQANHDALTGLPNRSLLEDRLKQACKVAARSGRKVAVLFFDLDGFKPINDTLGYQIGDQVLTEVALRLESRIRCGDTVARCSGDEFIVVLPDLAQPDDVLAIVEKLLQAIAAPYHIQSHVLRLTASVGIAMDDGKTSDPVKLVLQADLAMVRAKHHGRNTYQWFASDLTDKANRRVELRNELQRTLEENEGELAVFYQPIIEGATGSVSGSEALVRWHHPSRGLVPPDQFVPLAEDTGQIIKLGEWVLWRACFDAVHLHGIGYQNHKVSVNVSPVQLRQEGFVELVKKVLRRTGLAPNLLELEIVESVVIYDTHRVVERLHELRALGVGIAIDDFGTGFSSLSYLKIMPVSKIKIDRSFVNDVFIDPTDAAITQGILSLAHHLSLDVVAEGVETEAHSAFLRKHNCQLLQGYLFAKPMPFEDLTSFLSKHNASCPH